MTPRRPGFASVAHPMTAPAPAGRIRLSEEAETLLREQARVAPERVIASIGRRARSLPPGRDLLLYVHVPFCSSKCTFCHWVAEVPVKQLRAGSSIRRRYVEAVCEQARWYGPHLADLGYTVRYIYFGGGTPSLLAPEELETLGTVLRDSFDLSELVEWTIESSPETLTPQKLAAMRRVGIERLSIGVQSFDERELRSAARAHSAEQAMQAFEMARVAGFSNINIDLIVAFPGQTEDVLAHTLSTTVQLDPEHVTAYNYLEASGTVMAKQIAAGYRPKPRLGDRVRARSQAHERLVASGYEEYMPSYYSRDEASRFRGEQYYFNLQGDFLGLGSGAHSIMAYHFLLNRRGGLPFFLTDPCGFDDCVQYDPARPEETHVFHVSPVLAGVDISYARFEERYGFDFRAIRNHPVIVESLKRLEARGAILSEASDGLHVTWKHLSGLEQANRTAATVA